MAQARHCLESCQISRSYNAWQLEAGCPHRALGFTLESSNFQLPHSARKLETGNWQLPLKAGCPHPARPMTRRVKSSQSPDTSSRNAGGVAAGSPGLARTRLPGVLRVDGHAPRRRCEDPLPPATLPGLMMPSAVSRGIASRPRRSRQLGTGIPLQGKFFRPHCAESHSAFWDRL